MKRGRSQSLPPYPFTRNDDHDSDTGTRGWDTDTWVYVRRDSKRLKKMGGVLSKKILEERGGDAEGEDTVNDTENDGAGVADEQHTDDSGGEGEGDGKIAKADTAAPDDEHLEVLVGAGSHSDDSESPVEVALDATKQQTINGDKGKGVESTDTPTNAAATTTTETAPTADTENPPASETLPKPLPIYRITYHSALPWSHTATGTGFTDDPALIALARSLSLSPYLKRPYKLWVVAIFHKQDASVFAMNGGVVELKSGNRATVNMYNAVMETRDWLVEKEACGVLEEGWEMDGEKVENSIKEEVKRMWAMRAKGMKGMKKGKGGFRLGEGLPGGKEKEVDDEEKEKVVVDVTKDQEVLDVTKTGQEALDVTKTDQEGREKMSGLGRVTRSMSAGKDKQNDQKREKKAAQGGMAGKGKAKAEGQADWGLLQKLHKEKMERVVKQQEEILKSVKGG